MGGLDHLGGDMEICGLEEVKDVTSAKKAKLSAKKNLEELRLNYSKSSAMDKNFCYEDDVLEALQPHSNLRILAVYGFEGRRLPWWMTDGDALSNLVILDIRNCHYCTQIKSFKRLHHLNELTIRNIFNMTCFGEDAAEGESSTRDAEEATWAYPSLRNLNLSYLPHLEEWLDVVFPNLVELIVEHCAKLRKAPCQFPSLKKLVLHKVGEEGVRSITKRLTSPLTSFDLDHNEVSSFLSSSSSSSSSLAVTEGFIQKKEESMPCNFIFNAFDYSSLHHLNVRNVSHIKSAPDLSMLSLLRKLTISECEELETMVDSSLHLLIALEELTITECRKLKINAVLFPPRLKSMQLSKINALVFDGYSWTNRMRSLTSLSIKNIPNLTQIPLEFLSSNEHLRIVYISHCQRFRGFGFVSSQQAKTHPVPPPPPRVSSLERLVLLDCPNASALSFHSLVFTRLRELELSKGLMVPLEGLQFLPALRSLIVGPFQGELDDFPFPVEAAQDINHLASSLCRLHICAQSNCKSLPDNIQHLHSLEFLLIGRFGGLTSLPEWLGMLTSLQTLIIYNCKSLMHLPSGTGMRQLASLRELYIKDCPLLLERCSKNKRGGGGEWEKISHIPIVEFSIPWYIKFHRN